MAPVAPIFMIPLTPPNQPMRLFATTALGMEPLLERELRELGARKPLAVTAGVGFEGDLPLAYRACLWSRVANRVLLPLTRFPAPSAEQLYEGVRALPWEDHLAPADTLAVDFTSSRSRITHTHFGALKVKDAIVDRFRDTFGERPSIDLARPTLRVNVRLHKDRATVSVDLSGDSLHKRGYRVQSVTAALKETLAAAILMRAGWPEIAARGGPLVDPLCGSGTLPIEAALIAARIAPGRRRPYFGFLGWRQHDAKLWRHLCAEADRIATSALPALPPITGFDNDPRALQAARANARRAGLEGRIAFEPAALGQAPPLRDSPPGLVVMNPPYGERMGEEHALVPLYQTIGATLRAHFGGWEAALFTGNPRLRIGLRPHRSHRLFNGALPCELALFRVAEAADQAAPATTDARGVAPERACRPPAASDAQRQLGAEFANRVRKNLRLLAKWTRKNDVSCYRIYDADLPDFALAIDLYAGDQRWLHVQEYAPPADVDPAKALARRTTALALLPDLADVASERVVFKVRRRTRGRDQYQKLASSKRFIVVAEGPARLWVNLHDHLDTGLFLDHRPLRAKLRELARGTEFLNLFAYTASATIHAALGGASRSTSVDLSATYLDWARRNLSLNQVPRRQHELVRADCLEWIEQRAVDLHPRRYDLILVDPPTFSNSKAMRCPFDIQRDHPWLLERVARLLAPEGLLVFTTHNRRFRLESERLEALAFEPFGGDLLPRDFQRNPKIHQGWMVRRKG